VTSVRRVLLGLAVALALADGSVVTLALPDILADYDVEIPTVAWVLTSYNLVLAVAALPLAYVARRRAVQTCATGLVVFAAASAACAFAPSFAVLLAGRCVQALGGAALVTSSLELLRGLEPRSSDAVTTWARAGIIGAALGPAAGGIITQLLGWEWIFAAQVPLALAPLVVLGGLPARVPEVGSRNPDVPANAALLLISGALAAALFLLVLLLVNGWRLEPAPAGVVVTAMPLAAVVAGRYASRLGGALLRAATGAVLVAGGLAALALLPHAGWAWTLAPQLLVGAGLGLALAALTERALAGRSPHVVHGGWTIASRHAGVVLGLLLLTPLFTAALERNQDEALAAGTAAVLDSRIPPLDKLRVAQDVLTEVDRAEGRMPDVRPAFEEHDEPEYTELESALEDQLDRAATNAFSSSFLLGAGLGLAALVPIAVAWGMR
jgi:predicted MFS family arabinose efflux permease